MLSHARSTLDSRRRPDATPVILLLTDGEAHGEEGSVLDSVAVAALDDVSIWAARLGTSQGGPLVQPGTEDVPLLDEFGEQVVATSDGQLLRSIASAGGGAYYDASDERGARALVEEVSALGRSVGDDDAPTNVTFWLLVMALPLLIWDGLADSGRSIRLRSEARGKS